MFAARRRTKNLARGLLSFTPWSGHAHRLVPRREWSIGLFLGSDPWPDSQAVSPFTQIFTRWDVTGPRSEFVADPFLIRVRERWHLFFETFSTWSGLGEIALAHSDDLETWTYEGIVLSEPYHLSYPYVFRHGDDVFMVPEASATRSVRLYRATGFPTQWEFETTLLSDRRFHDPSVVYFQNRWWMFVETAAARRYDTLRLYHSVSLTGPWEEHPQSPLVSQDATCARPAGRILQDGENLYRFAQDCSTSYGRSVSAFKITSLSPSRYSETRVIPDVLGEGPDPWQSFGMHHIDAHQLPDGTWATVVDGLGPSA